MMLFVRMKTLAKAAVLALVLAGCNYPAEASYVTESPPPATNQHPVLGATTSLVVTESAGTGVVFLVYDPTRFDGTDVANRARSLDESIVKVLPATSEGTVHYGAPEYTGPVFVLVGVKPGEALIEVSRDGDISDRVGVRVVAQE